ncbi:MAG TPA: hypothetical protein VF802_08150 [Candidatus Limnocylindrales bacterium]
MISPLLVGLGTIAILLGAAILRSFGAGYRVGRLLAATPTVSVADAVALASAARPRYVRIEGRIDAEDEFEDEHHRPLVLRRVRLEARVGRAWQQVADHRRVVHFVVNEDLDSIAVDGSALDGGLVVIPRESAGIAADAPDAVPAHLPPETPVRMRVDQVSSIDHATVCGVPSLDATGSPVMTAGIGRPLVLTTLDRDEAMRVLARGSRIRPIAAAAALAAGVLLLVLGLVAGIVSAVAPAAASANDASGPAPVGAAVAVSAPGAGTIPSAAAASAPAASDSAASGPAASDSAAPAPAASDETAASGDTRSSGQGPGFVGAPLLAIAGVVLVAAVTIAATLAYVGLTGGPSRGGSAPGR